MKKLKFLCGCIFLIVFAACEKGEIKISREELLYGKKDIIVLYPSYRLARPSVKNDSGSGKNGPSPENGLVEDVNIYVFNQEGDLVSYRYCRGNEPLELEIYSKMKYAVYAVANAGKRLPARSVPEIEELECEGLPEDIPGDSPGAVLMTGKTSWQTLAGVRSISVDLVRCVAKVTVRTDFSELYPDVALRVKKIGIKNVPRRIALFRENAIVSASDADSGETVETPDREMLESGLSFYTWENRQGTLLPGNAEQPGKVWPAEDIHSKICTYLEIAASYESPRKKGNILYRFYLGTDMVSNFDVIRNRQYNLTVFFKGDGAVEENTWRVDNSDITDLVVSVGMDPVYYKFTVLGDTKQMMASVFPESAGNRVLSWNSSDRSVAVVDQNGVVTSKGDGVCTVTASSTDGTNVSASCTVEVDSKVYMSGVSVHPETLILFTGESRQLEASVEPPEATVPELVWRSSDPAVAGVDGNGKVTAVKEGTARIEVSAAGRRAVCAVTVAIPRIGFPESGRIMYDGEIVTIPYSVLVPSAVIPEAALSNDHAEILEVTSTGIRIRAKTAGTCRMSAKIGNACASYDLDIQELKIVFNDPAPLEIYNNFKKEISYTVYPEHARTLSVEFHLRDQVQDEPYIEVVPEKNSVIGRHASTDARPVHYINAGFKEYPEKIFTTMCKVKDSRVMNDTVKLVANRALSRYYNDPLSKSEGFFAVDTDPGARPVWKIEGTGEILVTPDGKVSLAGNKTAVNGVYNMILSITGDNNEVMTWQNLKVIVYEELNLYSILVANETGVSGDDLVYDQWRESQLGNNPLSPFWKNHGNIYPDIIYIPPWEPVVNGVSSVVSEITTAYYPVGVTHIFSPASIEIPDKNRWTVNTEKGYYFYITSHPLYQFTESYWKLFYPEG